jgi:uncharacterized protein YggE
MSALIIPAALQAQQRANPQQPLITVTGTAQVQAIPDIVELQAGVNTHSRDLKAACSEQDKLIRAILEVARKSGIDTRDVRTSHVEIQPVYHEQDRGMDLSYYAPIRSVGLTLRDPGKYDALVPDLLESGANRIFGVNFRSSQQRIHRDRAREMATVAAREKAAAIAAKLGQQIGKAFTIQEEEPVRFEDSNFSNISAAASGGRAGQTDVSDSGLALGQLSFTAIVRVSFELK